MDINSILTNLQWINQVAGFVWLGLTAIMLWILFHIREEDKSGRANSKWVLFLLVLVWLYPLYTLGFSSLILGEIGNILTLGFTLFVLIKLREKSPSLSRLLIPQCIWLTAATAYVGLQLASGYGI